MIGTGRGFGGGVRTGAGVRGWIGITLPFIGAIHCDGSLFKHMDLPGAGRNCADYVTVSR